MKTQTGLVAVILTALAGCFGGGALRSASSGYIGCLPGEIEITNDDVAYGRRTWDATCRGRTFHCSGVAKAGMSCVEDRAAVPVAPVTPVASRTVR
jgi:hypothetical protein